MRSDRDLLERQIADVELRPFTLDGFHRRRQQKQRNRRIATAVVGLVVAAVAAGGIVTTVDTDPDEKTFTTDVPAPESSPTAVDRMVDALNTRDVDAFVEAFYVAEDNPDAVGGFAPRGDFAESSSIYPSWQYQPITDAELVDAWMGIVDAWGLEAEVSSCTRRTKGIEFSDFMVDAILECDVVTRWHTLSLEITESWLFELHGSEVLYWDSLSCCRRDLDLVDLDPPDHSLPLGYAGLEAWEAWLEANHPEDAARLLYRREGPSFDCPDDCPAAKATLAPGDPERASVLARLVGIGGDGWVIDGHLFTPTGLIPYDPALADEIEASIHEFLGDQ